MSENKKTSVTSISRSLKEIEGRIPQRKQSDLRYCHDLSKSLLSFARAYLNAKKTGFQGKNIEKMDATIDRVFSS